MPDQPLRILVVDDNHDNAEIVRKYLESTRDFLVAVTYDGDDALRSFNASRPDVVLLDVMMPGRDGWDVCRAMKSDPEQAARTRVIMLTARNQLSDRRMALQSGADDFLDKPLELSRLLATVRRNAAALTEATLTAATSIDTPASAVGQKLPPGRVTPPTEA